MRSLLAIPVIALAAVFQALALPLYRLGSAAPDFVLLAAIYLGLFAPTAGAGGAVGSIAHLLVLAASSVALDLFSLDPLGAHAAAFIPALLLARRSRRRFLLEEPFLRASVVFAAALLGMAMRAGFIRLREGIAAPWMPDLLLSALYTALLAIPFYAILDPQRHQLGWIGDRRFAGGR